MPDQTTTDGTDVPATLEVTADQLRVMLEPTREAIVDLLTEGPATVSQLAEAFGKPKGTIAHHCTALKEAGLIYVQRTRRVRAIDENFYARTARTFLLGSAKEGAPDLVFSPLTSAAREKELSRQQADTLGDLPSMSTFRHLRIPEERAEEWSRRLIDLAAEFVEQQPGGTISFGLALALFPTTRPVVASETESGGDA